MIRSLVVMGVAGCGKSTIAAMLAARLERPFVEGDALHPAANIMKMQAGIALEDADREPWLRLVAARLDEWRDAGTPGVITCSALRRAYRAVLDGGHGDVGFVYLRGSREIIAGRMAARRGHFMPTALLDSQFANLEEPLPPEPAITIDVGLPAGLLLEAILRQLPALEHFPIKQKMR